jgi:ribosomal protein L10
VITAVIPTLKGQTSVLFADKGNAPAKMIKDFRKKDTKTCAEERMDR